MQSGVLFEGCSDARIIGNTFDYQGGTAEAAIDACTNTQFENNIVLNDGAAEGVSVTGENLPGGKNVFYPMSSSLGGIFGDPQLHASAYHILSNISPAYYSGTSTSTGAKADINGWIRHESTPCVGAFERVSISQSAAGDGRITSRIVAGETYSLSYGVEGRLCNYNGPNGSGDYEFDHLGRRTKMTVTVNGEITVTRMIYQGHDVIAELIDEGDNGSIDRRRIYWILPQIDQRIGFVDIEGATATAYYYETDQVGSVVQVRDSSGTVVNRYIYDAFGNQLPGTFEEVPNRYRFQGREWDEGIQAYYFRYRHYFPETGQFSGPDMDVRMEEGAPGNYLFPGNNPLMILDPMGLWGVKIGSLPNLGWGDPNLVFNKNSVRAEDLVTGAQAVGNAAADTVVGFATLNQADPTNLFGGQNKFGYSTAYGVSRVGTETLGGIATGGLGTLSKVGKAAAVIDVAGNALMAGQGVANMAKNGVNLQNSLQTVGGLAGIGGTVAGARAMKGVDSSTDAVGGIGKSVDEVTDAVPFSGKTARAYKSGPRIADETLLRVNTNTSHAQNLTEWRRTVSKTNLKAERTKFVGTDAVKVAPGTWRSLDGTRQFRTVPSDYLGRHNIGSPPVPNTPHVHFEFLAPPNPGGKNLRVLKNVHVPLVN